MMEDDKTEPMRITKAKQLADEVAAFYWQLRRAQIDDDTARALTLQAMADGRI